MKKNVFSILLAMAISIYSCKEGEIGTDSVEKVSHEQLEANRESFAKTLAVGLKDQFIRKTIREEALKQFDGEAEVLFQQIKTEQMPGGKTILDYLGSIYGNTAEFEQMVNSIPTLTIMVPYVKNFSIKEWDASNVIPAVAALPTRDGNKKITNLKTFYENGKEIELSRKIVPTEPILVVKDSERVVVNGSSEKNSTLRQNGVFNAGGFEYVFLDASYRAPQKDPGSTARHAPYTEFDSRVAFAFDNNLQYHRDYVYYGIAPELGVNTGSFNSNYAEYLTEVQFTWNSVTTVFEDPATDWSDGNLELQINILLVNGKTAGTNLPKVVNIPVEIICWCDPWNSYPNNFNVAYKLPGKGIELIPWDMQQYGDTWKISVVEQDAPTTTVLTINQTIGSTFGTNFTNNVKDGANFGSNSSSSQQFSQTFQYTVTGQSDVLGDALLSWRDKVLIADGTSDGWEDPARRWGTTHNINTGIV